MRSLRSAWVSSVGFLFWGGGFSSKVLTITSSRVACHDGHATEGPQPAMHQQGATPQAGVMAHPHAGYGQPAAYQGWPQGGRSNPDRSNPGRSTRTRSTRTRSTDTLNPDTLNRDTLNRDICTVRRGTSASAADAARVVAQEHHQARWLWWSVPGLRSLVGRALAARQERPSSSACIAKQGQMNGTSWGRRV